MNFFRIFVQVISLIVLSELPAQEFTEDEEPSYVEERGIEVPTSFSSASSVESNDQPMSIESKPVPPTSNIFFARTSTAYNGVSRLIITEEYLYLAAREEGLGYGTTTGFSTLPANSTQAVLTQAPAFVFAGEERKLNPGFASGSRLGISYSIPTNNWNVRAAWTWYANSATDSTNLPIWPFWLNSGFTPLAGSATGKWNLYFNQLDGLIGACCFSNRFVRITPSIGVRGAWIDQTIDVTYNNVIFQNGISTIHSSIQSNNQSNCSGVGLLGSIDIDWVFGKGFSLYTNGAVALLWSSFNIQVNEILPNGTSRATVTDPLQTTSPVLDLSAGVQWETTLLKDRLLLQIQLGWEEHLWFDQNQFDRSMDSQTVGVYMNTNGNLGLSGLTASLSLGF